ncbi:MAG: hypothetical protein Q7U04_10820 [Bacteriovorax sp.]|nr:hypothetical protein [Bacteriovorax sp.]
MKFLLLTVFLLTSLNAFSKEEAKTDKKILKVVKEEPKPAVPCESKEELLKKLKEKSQSEKPKAFSLQGGDTGCSVK